MEKFLQEISGQYMMTLFQTVYHNELNYVRLYYWSTTSYKIIMFPNIISISFLFCILRSCYWCIEIMFYYSSIKYRFVFAISLNCECNSSFLTSIVCLNGKKRDFWPVFNFFFLKMHGCQQRKRKFVALFSLRQLLLSCHLLFHSLLFHSLQYIN